MGFTEQQALTSGDNQAFKAASKLEAKDFLEACGFGNIRELYDALGLKGNANKKDVAGETQKSESNESVHRADPPSKAEAGRPFSTQGSESNRSADALPPVELYDSRKASEVGSNH